MSNKLGVEHQPDKCTSLLRNLYTALHLPIYNYSSSKVIIANVSFLVPGGNGWPKCPRHSLWTTFWRSETVRKHVGSLICSMTGEARDPNLEWKPPNQKNQSPESVEWKPPIVVRTVFYCQCYKQGLLVMVLSNSVMVTINLYLSRLQRTLSSGAMLVSGSVIPCKSIE